LNSEKEWNEYFANLCRAVAKKSKDRSTKVGCIITGPDKEIRTTGYNGFVRGANDEREDWHQRPMKYSVTAHAETNAICSAARVGTPLKGCTAYISLPPCATCALLLAQAGITEIKVLDYPEDWASLDRWQEEFKVAQEILKEAKVSFSFLDK
jgi:dCMP deaminase